MRSARAWIATGFMLASSMAPAMAADWGGVKDMGGGVPIPVPAPAPVPTYDADSDWYIGLALGGNLLTDADIKDTNTDNLGRTSSTPLARSSSDLSSQVMFGLTFGRYITPSLRWEVAVDYTPDTLISRNGAAEYTSTNSASNPVAGGTDTNFYDTSRNQNVKLSRTTALFNLLYDIPTGTRFTPFLGGGLGVTWRRVKSSFGEASTCTGSVNSEDPTLYPVNSCASPYVSSSSPNPSAQSKNQIDLAAAVQAGIATNLTDSIIWDNSWQMVWEGGSISVSSPSVGGQNRFTFENSVLQQFRSGIRIKFD